MGTSTQTTTSSIPGANDSEVQLRALLSTLAKSSAGQMGDVSALAKGDMSPSASDRTFIETAQNAAAEIARKNAERNFVSQRGAVEDSLLGRGMDNASIEAVVKATLGQSNLDTLNNITLQQQGQTAEQMTSLPFQRANVQLSANQMLLEKLLGASNPVMQASLQERLAQGTTTQKTKGNPWQMVMDLAKEGATAYAGK